MGNGTEIRWGYEEFAMEEWTTAAPEVVNIWSASHSYVPQSSPRTSPDPSPWFQYVDVGEGRRCYRMLAYNPAGNGPLSAVTCGYPIGQSQ